MTFAQDRAEADSSVADSAFADQHMRLDLDGLQPPWLGSPYENQRINWSLDSTNILYNSLQREWKHQVDGPSGGVFLYQILAGDTTGIPIAFDFDTYRLIKSEQNTISHWQLLVQRQLKLRDRDKARDLVSISLPFKLPKAVTSIVGEGGAGLRVNGFKRINFSGRSSWNDVAQTTSAQSQSRFPALDMEQITQMTITGKIGTKIEVKIDQDSRRITDLGNRIQIRYRGDEDEILQTIEAGNTNLALPNTQFVGYSQRVQGLFGLKTTAKIGNLSLTAIASQEKGSTEGATFTAGAQGAETFLRDYQYLRNRYFWLFNPFTDTVWARYVAEGAVISDFKLYRNIQNFGADGVEGDQAVCVPGLTTDVSLDSVAAAGGYENISSFARSLRVSLVEYTDYLLVNNRFYIVINDSKPINELDLLACYMTIERPGGIIDTLGDIRFEGTTSGNDTTLLLTLIKSDEGRNASAPTWLLEWKNVYSLGARDISIEGLKVDVYRGAAGTERQEGENFNTTRELRTPLLQILGLDLTSTDGSAVPDGEIDDSQFILDRARGHLIFPNSFPFAPAQYPIDPEQVYPFPFKENTTHGDILPYPKVPDTAAYSYGSFGEELSYENLSVDAGLTAYGDTLEEQAPGIYNSGFADQRQRASIYYLAITTTERRTSYSLGRVNILEGSEVVKLNGRQLTRGVDYTINEALGQITFISEEVLDPNAKVTVDYEYEPFFTVERKSLLGFRGEYTPSQSFSWGATMLFKTEQQPDNQKPRLGEEASRMLIWDTDMKYRRPSDFITRLVDALPGIEATAPSAIDFQAEIARSLPNPNTQGEVFIDDFEGSQEIISLPLRRSSWTISSPPAGLNTLDRVRLEWYNRFEPYRATEIYNKEELAADDRAQVLSLKMKGATKPADWAGVIRSVSTGLQNLSTTQYIEFRVQGDTGLLVFDMGKISEDVNDDGIWNREDVPAGTYYNGVLDSLEDTGLDGVFNKDEVDKFGNGYDAITNPDPHGDDWFYDKDTRNDYSRINGTEGNRLDAVRGWVPDTEDINGNNAPDRVNEYFEFQINLADSLDQYLVRNSEFCDACSDSASLGPWRTFRIPMPDSLGLNPGVITVGNPSLETIQFMRLYLTGVDSGAIASVNIADMNLVSYRWRDVRIEAVEDFGQELRVAVINTRENSDYRLDPPPGVKQVVDRVTQIGAGEQSLLLAYSNLQPFRPDSIVIVQDSIFDTASSIWIDADYPDTVDFVDRVILNQTLLTSLDYTGYRRLQMLVHGDDSEAGDLEFFLRFGSDTANYYEYRTRIWEGWDPRNHIDVDFNELTGFKFNAQQGLTSAEKRDLDTISADNRFRIRGNPSLSRISILEMGVANFDVGSVRSGEVWVNELRLTEVRKDAGWAARFSASLTLSDLGRISVSYRAQNYAFKTLTQSSRNIVNSSSLENLSISASIAPTKFLPPSWKWSLPISVNWSKSTNKPYFLTRSDIVVPEDQRDHESSRTENKGISIAERYQKSSNPNFLEAYLLIPLSLSASYSESKSESPVVFSSTSKSYNGTARYQITFPKPPGVPLLYWTRYLFLPASVYNSRFTLFPSRFNSQGQVQQRSSERINVEGALPITSFSRTFTGSFQLSYVPLLNTTLDYTYNTSRDLSRARSHLLGEEINFSQSYRSSYTNKWIPFLEQRYNYDVSYQEKLEVQSNNTRSISSTRNFQASYGLSWANLVGGHNPEDRWLTPRIYQPIRKLVRSILLRLNGVSGSYGQSRAIRDFGLTDSPNWKFIFGLTNDAGSFEPDSTSISSQRNSSGVTESYSARTGINLLSARISVGYTERIQNNDNGSSNTRNSTKSFPALRVTFSDLTKIGLIEKVANSASLDFGFDRSTNSQGRITDTGFDETSNSTDTRYSPLIGLNLNWRGNVSTTFKKDHTTRITTNSNQSQTKSTDDQITMNMRYSFRAPDGIKLPFLGGIRLSSTMNISAAISWTKSKGEQKPAGDSNFSLRSERTSFSVAPSAGYSFSSTLTGGFRGRWSDTEDKVLQRKSHVRELGFWVEFRF